MKCKSSPNKGLIQFKIAINLGNYVVSTLNDSAHELGPVISGLEAQNSPNKSVTH